MRIFICFLIFFLVGGFGMIFIDLMRALILIGIILNVYIEPAVFWKELQNNRIVVLFPVILIGYLLLHTAVLHIIGSDYKFSYGFFELLGFYVLAIPIYAISIRSCIDRIKFYKLLVTFCVGVLLCYLYMCFDMYKAFPSGTSLAYFTEYLLESRFGGNKDIWSGHIFLEAQAMSLGLAALILFYLSNIIEYIRYKVAFTIGFFMLLVLLVFTVTKSTLIGFFIALLVLTYRILVKIEIKKRLILLIGVVILVVGAWNLLPEGVHARLELAENELLLLFNKQVATDVVGNNISILPRVMVYKEVFSHISEFGLQGLGTIYNSKLNNWFTNSEYKVYIDWLTDPHNSFLYFWLLGGIIGFAYVLFIFFSAIFKMIISKDYSYFIIGLIVFLAITNSTCTLLALNNSRALIILFLSMFYIYLPEFIHLEKRAK